MLATSVLALGTVLLAGCGMFGAEPTPTPEPVTLRYITIGVSKAEERLLERFTAQHPSITIESEPYRTLPADYLTGDDAPDLMYITPGWFLNSAAATGQLTDLTDLWEQTGLNQSYPASVKALSEREGRQIFLPVGYTWTGLYYNAELFAQYGIAPPDRWDNLLLAADTLLANGITPFALPGDDDLYSTLWFDYLNRRLNGADLHQALLRGDIPFSDARIEAVFDTWNWMFDQGYFDRDAANTDLLTALLTTVQRDESEVVRGKSGMVLVDPGTFAELPDAFRDELTFAPFPVIDPMVSSGEVVIATGYMAPAQAPHVDQTLDFLRFVAGPDAAEALAGAAVALDSIPAAGLSAFGFGPNRDPSGGRADRRYRDHRAALSVSLHFRRAEQHWADFPEDAPSGTARRSH